MRELTVLSLFLVSLFATQSAVTAQETTQQKIVPSDPYTSVTCCILVRCANGNEYLCSGTGNTLPEAEQNAINVCGVGKCGGTAPVKVPRPVPVGACDEESFIALRQLQAGAWRVEAVLHYCDGTTLGGIIKRGSTYCEAVRNARNLVCQIKDPCRRVACICYIIHERPACP